MSAQVNLLRDGIERAAAHVFTLVQSARCRQTVLVRPLGRVSVYRPAQVSDADAPCIAGTYTDSAPVEVIENDLLVRLREITGRMAA